MQRRLIVHGKQINMLPSRSSQLLQIKRFFMLDLLALLLERKARGVKLDLHIHRFPKLCMLFFSFIWCTSFYHLFPYERFQNLTIQENISPKCLLKRRHYKIVYPKSKNIVSFGIQLEFVILRQLIRNIWNVYLVVSHWLSVRVISYETSGTRVVESKN